MVSKRTGSHLGKDARTGAGLSVLIVAAGWVFAAGGAARAQTCSPPDCNDGLFCTLDFCIGGNCIHTQNNCDDTFFCTDDACNEATNTCDHTPHICPPLTPPKPYCDDNLDACVRCLQDSHCTTAPRLTCDNSTGTCVQCLSDFECQDVPVPLVCNGTERCNLSPGASYGLCQAGTPLSCPKKCFRGTTPGATCTTDTNCGTGGKCLGFCSELRGTCVQCDHAADYAHGGCDDGKFCSGAEACQNDLCVAGPPPVCKKCVNGPDNLQPCSTNADCRSPGTCTGGPSYCEETLDRCVQCLNSTQCEDLNFCTSNICLFNSCVFTANPAICSDGLFCNGEEACNYQLGNSCSQFNDRTHCCFKGICSTSTPPKGCNSNADCPAGTGICNNQTATNCNADHSVCSVDCSDDFSCTTDSCNEAADSCQHVPNDSKCGACHPGGILRCFGGTNDGQVCVNSTQCPSGTCEICVRDSDCPDAGQQCVRTSFGKECLPSTTCGADTDCLAGQTCWSPSISGRGNLQCDGNEKCTPTDPNAGAQTGCLAGTPVNCSSLDGLCSVGACAEQPTVHCQATPQNQGASCNDFNPCTAVSKCNNGFCVDNPPAANDPYRCVKLEWRPPTVAPVLAGSTVVLGLYAVANGCNTPTADCPGTSLEVSTIDALFSWNKTVLQLQPSTGPDPNPADPCVRADSCRVCPADQYAWGFSGWINDCIFNGDHLNDPCSGGVPANDGNARYLGFLSPQCSLTCRGGSNNGLACCLSPPCPPNSGLVDCGANGMCSDLYCNGGSNDGLPCSSLADCPSGIECTNLPAPACATTTGLEVTTIKFKAISGGISQIALLPCFGAGSKTAVQSPITNPLTSDVTKSLGPAVTITVTCDSDDDCNDNNVCTNDSCCLTSPCTGTCQHVINTNTCDDGLFCTTNDRCVSGVCQGGAAACSPPLLCDEATDRCVQCLSVANCNDGLACTVDACVNGSCQHTAVDCNDHVACTTDACVEPNGTCTHTPSNAFCNPTGSFCSSAVCDLVDDCVFDHECISTNGNPCPNPATCNEGSRTCGGCKQPTVVSIGCRYLAVTPAEQGSTPLALVVVGECSNPSAACVYQYVQSKCNLGANNGQNCLVNADCPKTCAGGLNPGTPCTTNAQCSLGTCAGTCEAGTLGSTPFYKTASQWGTAKVRGAQIRPGTDYLVETQCDFPGVVLSAATTARTWRWGDIDGNGIVNALDIAQLVDAFKGRVGSVPWEQANIWGCAPDAFLDALDITEDVDAFKGLQFPCGITCP
jgi:hypothetical protein